MKFICTTKSVKADLVKNEITLTFVLDLDEGNMTEARELAPYCAEDAGDVELTILPRQISLFNKKVEVKMTHR